MFDMIKENELLKNILVCLMLMLIPTLYLVSDIWANVGRTINPDPIIWFIGAAFYGVGVIGLLYSGAVYGEWFYGNKDRE